MADRNVTIRISATDQFSDVFRRYQRAVGGAEQVTDRAGQSVRRQQGLWSDLSTEVRGAVAAFGLIGVIRVGSDMVRLGQQVTATRAAFERLSGGAGEAAANLEMMREATRGGADDLTLMQGANRLLIMNLAETGDEAARLTEIAVTLGRVMGQDASQAIESFSLMLSNRSIPRLDNFGISASAVRERIQELKDAGMGLDEAFTLAVLEQGELSMDRLGDAVEQTVTAVDRLETRWANLWAQASENVAIGVNSIIESMDRLFDTRAEYAPSRFLGGAAEAYQSWSLAHRDEYAAQQMGLPYNPRTAATWGDVYGTDRARGIASANAMGPYTGAPGVSQLGAGDLSAMLAPVGNWSQYAAEGLEEVAESSRQAALSLSEMMSIGRYPGAGGEALGMIMDMLPEDQRQAFGIATGLITPQEQNLDAITTAIAAMSGQGQVDAALSFAQLLNAPGAEQTMIQSNMAGIMGRMGYFQGPGGGQFTVNPGDTAWGLSQQYGMSVDQILSMAGVTDARMLQPGTYGGMGTGGWMPIVGGAGPSEQGDAGWGERPVDITSPWEAMRENMDAIGTQAISWSEAVQIVSETAPEISEESIAWREAMEVVAPASQEFAGYCEDAASSAEELQDAFSTLTADIQQIQIEFTGDVDLLRAITSMGSVGGTVTVNAGGGGTGGGGVSWRDGMATVNSDNGGVPPGSANTGGPVGGSPLMPGL